MVRSGASCAALDASRTATFVGFESAYRGVLQQPLLQWATENFRGEALRWAALERTLVSQFIFAPFIYYPLFFTITGIGQGLTLRQCGDRASAQFPKLFGRNLFFWLPVQLIQFTLIPTRYKVPFICAAGSAWNLILSALAGSARAEARQAHCSNEA